MKLLMISGDRSLLQGKKGAFWYTLEELRKQFDRIDIITPKPSLSCTARLASPFDGVFIHPSPRGLWYQPWWILRKGKEIIAQERHDVMTVHEYPPFYNGIGARMLHRPTAIPYALEIHHIVGFPRAATLAEWIGRHLSRWMLPITARHATAVRCVNASTTEILRLWGLQNLTVIPSMYLDHAILKADATIPKQYDVVCCARLVPNKRIDSILKALQLLPHVTLLILGDGPQRAALERLARHLGIRERVTFAGWTADNADVYRAMQSARVCVMASTSEGGPRSALEAMALGLPVIATRVGLMPDVIDHGTNGLLTTGEPADIAAHILMLLQDDPLRAAMGTEARHVLDRFERHAAIKAYADFLIALRSPASSS